MSASTIVPRRERRVVRGAAQLRSAAGAPPKIGMRIPFGRRSQYLCFTEIIDRHAFDATLEEPGSDVVALWQHDSAWVLGRQSNRTLSISVGPDALDATVMLDPANKMHVDYFAPSVASGDVIGASFGFETVRDRWADEAGGSVRTLLEVKLFDISAVTFPAYEDSEAELRALLQARGSHRSVAQRLQQLRRRELDRRICDLGLDSLEARRRKLDARTGRLDADLRAAHGRNELRRMLLRLGVA